VFATSSLDLAEAAGREWWRLAILNDSVREYVPHFTFVIQCNQPSKQDKTI
jgi:hypothetical protein